jgi:hypothetical protein
MSRHHLPTWSAVNTILPRGYRGSITNLGTQVTPKNHNYVNPIGFDVGMVSADGILTNGPTSTTLTAVGENRSVATDNSAPPSVSSIICRAPPEDLSHVIPLPFLAAWHTIPAGGHAPRRDRHDRPEEE